MSQVVVLYGPSASGKSEIQNHLIAAGFPKIVTSTTRKPRKGEEDGVHYHFMSRPAFEEKLAEGCFLEWTEYNGEYYGTLQSSIGDLADGGHSASIILDLAGVKSLKSRYANIFALYVGADALSIERRLSLRGGNADEMLSRIARAKELELGADYMQAADAVIWNDDGTSLDETLREVDRVLRLE